MTACAVVALAGCAVHDYVAECNASFAALPIGTSIGHARSALACPGPTAAHPNEWVDVSVYESASARDEYWHLPSSKMLHFENGVLQSKDY